MNRAWWAAIFLLLGSSFFLSAGAAQSTLRERGLTLAAQAALRERVLKADAYDLAHSYFYAKWMMEEIIPMVEKGFTIILPEGKLTKRKARRYKKEYFIRFSIYAEAIIERGYKTIAGSYQRRGSKSCKRIRSALNDSKYACMTSDVEIQQDGYEARLIVRFEHEGKEITLEHPMIVVETAVMVMDATNSDYFFRGEIKGKKIVLKPELSVLAGWPKWAGPPLEQDLRECTITLEPRKGNPSG